jgi:hypothetical protein
MLSAIAIRENWLAMTALAHHVDRPSMHSRSLIHLSI